MSSESAPTEAPGPVRLAHRLWLVIVALTLVDTVVSEVAAPTTVTGDVPVVVVYVIAVVVIAAFLGLIVLFAYKMRAGRNWARIALVVVAVLTCLVLRDVADPFTGAVDVLGRVIDVLAALMAVAAVVLSYRPASAPWFRTAPVSA